MTKMLILFMIICIISEAIVLILKEKAWNLRYVLLSGSFPILIVSIYELRFLLYGIEGLKEHFFNPHTSHWLMVLCLTIAIINFLTYQIIMDMKKER